MKKTIKLLGIFVINTLIIIGCENPAEHQPHIHQWGDWQTIISSTCTTEGIETRHCILNAKHVETRRIAINFNAHMFGEWTETTAPTEYDDGEETRYCAYDSRHIETRPIAALGHTHVWGDWIQTLAPTCVTEGEETRHCSLNEEHIETRPINALGHDWGDWTQIDAPTCTIQGLEFRTCKRNCGIADERQPIPALGHIPNTETGFCTVCNDLGYNIGDTGPGGGIIFYKSVYGFTFFTSSDDSIGVKAHYLEAAPTDMGAENGGLSYHYQWPGKKSNRFTVTNIFIGYGKKNTELIEAGKHLNLTINDKIDWFIPSYYECVELYNQQAIIGNLTGSEYWTSSRYDSAGGSVYSVYIIDMSYGSFVRRIYDTCHIRAIRAF